MPTTPRYEMFVRPLMLSILTTRRCTAACDHCCVGANPRATAAIPVERIRRLIDEACDLPTIERITFSGGECFLLGRDLDALVAHAHARGFLTRAMTNGYWAVNVRAARERVTALRAAGLDELMLSTGDFHGRFVPLARVVRAACAAVDAGLPVRVSVETCDQSAFDETPLREALAGALASGAAAIGHDPWIEDAAGRGSAALTHDAFRASAAAERADGRCANVMNVLTVTPDQQLVACCGFPLEELPELRIGSVAERPLGEVVASAPDRLIPMWLHARGPAAIAAFAARHVPGYAPAPSASICQTCVAVQRDVRVMRAVSEHAHEIVHEIAADYLRLHRPPPAALSA